LEGLLELKESEPAKRNPIKAFLKIVISMKHFVSRISKRKRENKDKGRDS